MNEREFKERTKNLALRVVRLVGALPRTTAADVIGKQLLRSATSVEANYRAACRARSTADLISKLSIVLYLLKFSGGSIHKNSIAMDRDWRSLISLSLLSKGFRKGNSSLFNLLSRWGRIRVISVRIGG